MLKIKFLNKENIILVIFIILIINNFNFFKNYYFIITRDFDTRLNKVYDFCGNESVGFLSYIKNKYKIEKKISIRNYKISPDPSWVFYNGAKSNIDKDRLILLNYKDESELNFIKINKNNFKAEYLPSNIYGINKILFESKEDLNEQLIFISIIYKIDEYRKVIFKEKIKIDLNNEYLINLENKDLNIRNGNLYIKLENAVGISDSDMKIDSIKFYNKTKFNLKEYKIIEKISNCYFLKNNV